MSWVGEWNKVIFSDEKKVNLDGPDGFRYYFHDLRKEEKFLSKRKMGGGSIMVWAPIGFLNKGEITFLPRRVNAEAYKNILEEAKIEFLGMAGENYIFQQDNAPVHNARTIKSWFQDHNIETLSWPALSPDLNIIENVDELKIAILSSWEDIGQEEVQNLNRSLPNRMFEVIHNRGGSTKY